jgi:hypothetical protein
MKKLLILALVIVVVIWFFGKRVYLRDPIGTVYRDEVEQSGVQVFINERDELLLVKDSEPGAFRTILQYWDRFPGTPVTMTCLRWTACVTETDNVAKSAVVWTGTGPYDPKATMTGHEITFVDADGSKVRVELR